MHVTRCLQQNGDLLNILLCQHIHRALIFLLLGISLLALLASILQLFEVQIDNAEVLLRYSSALVQGATNVFWYAYLHLHVSHGH